MLLYFRMGTWQIQSFSIFRNTCSNLVATCKVKVCLPCTADTADLAVKGEILFNKCDLHDQKKFTS